jgi:hypothetical protein
LLTALSDRKQYHKLTEHILQDIGVHLADFNFSMEDHRFKEGVLVLLHLLLGQENSVIA